MPPTACVSTSHALSQYGGQTRKVVHFCESTHVDMVQKERELAAQLPHTKISVVNTFVEVVDEEPEGASDAVSKSWSEPARQVVHFSELVESEHGEAPGPESGHIDTHVISEQLPQHKIRIVNTFVEGVEGESDDDFDAMAKACSEPPRRSNYLDDAFGEGDEETLEPETLQTKDTNTFNQLPQHQIRIVNTFIEPAEELEDEEPIVKARTEPRISSGLLLESEANEQSDTEDLPVTSTKTFDPFDHPRLDAQADMSDIDDTSVLRTKTYDPFERPSTELCVGYRHNAKQEVIWPQPSTMVEVPMLILAQMTAAALPAWMPASERHIPVSDEPLPCLLGQTSLQTQLSDHSDTNSKRMGALPEGSLPITWNLEGRKLKSASEKQLLSHEFTIHFPGQGPQPFRMMVAAKQMTRHKGGQTFAKANGRSRLFVKCTGSMPDSSTAVAFRVTAGEDSRGPFWHQFADQSCCELQAIDEDWDLLAALRDSKRLEVRLEVVGHSSSTQN